MKGKVITVPKKGWAFAKGDDGVEVFCHQSQVADKTPLAKDQVIEYDLGPQKEGALRFPAVNIRILSAPKAVELKAKPKSKDGAGNDPNKVKTAEKKTIAKKEEGPAIKSTRTGPINKVYTFQISFKPLTKIFFRSSLPTSSHPEIIWCHAKKWHPATKAFTLDKTGNRKVQVVVPPGLGATISFADSAGNSSAGYYCSNR